MATTLKRTCYFCGKPVPIRARMSLFCSRRCEELHKSLSAAGPEGPPPRPETAKPRTRA